MRQVQMLICRTQFHTHQGVNIKFQWMLNLFLICNFFFQVVVIIVIWIISILVIYMLFLMCLEPLLNKRVKTSNYQEHTNEDVHNTYSKYAGIKYSQLVATLDDDDDDVDHYHDHDDDDEAQLVGNKETLSV